MTAQTRWLRALLGFAAGAGLAANAAESHNFTNVNKAIPDGNLSGLSDSRSITSSVRSVGSVRVTVRIEGEYNGDLYAYLRHIQGGRTNLCVLLNRPGRTGANPAGYADAGLNVAFEDAAAHGDVHLYRTVSPPGAVSPLLGDWQPDGRKVDPMVVTELSPRTTSLASFAGSDANGVWTLYLVDADSGGTNCLVSWGLELTGGTAPPISWPPPADMVYGTPLGSNQLNAASAVAGTFSYNPPPGTRLQTGAGQALSVTFVPDDSLNYVPTTTNVPITVVPAPLTIAANNAAKSYGAALPAFAASYVGFVAGEGPQVLATPVTFVTDATPASSVGAYTIVPGGATAANYNITFVPGTLTVQPTALTIRADDTSKVYGAPLPSFSASYSGFISGEGPEVLTSPVNYSTTASPTCGVGAYPIVPGGATAANYHITSVPGTLTVQPTALTIRADDTSKVYGAPLPSFSASYSGFISGEGPEVLGTPVTYSTAATPASNAGAYAIVPGGATAPNYSITFVPGALSITRASTAGSLVSSANPALPGTTVSMTWTLNAVPPGAGSPDGFVQFKIDGGNVGAPVPLAAGAAVYSSATLALGTHRISAEYGGSGNFLGTTNTLAPDQLVNTPPVAGPDSIEVWGTNRTKVAIHALLASDHDADGDTITWGGCSPTSAQGAALTEADGWVIYTPAPALTNWDSFTYTISDGRGAPVTCTVTVAFKADLVPSPNLVVLDLGTGTYRIRLDGIPDKTYRIEYTESIVTPDWRELGSALADGAGLFQYDDTPPSGTPTRYYRSVYP